MVVTFDHVLPTDEELTVPELNLSQPALRAGAFHLGKHCENEFNVSLFAKLNWSPINILRALIDQRYGTDSIGCSATNNTQSKMTIM